MILDLVTLEGGKEHMVPTRIRMADDGDLDAIVVLNAALFQEDAGQRDPFMNLDWPQQEGHAYFSRHLKSEASCCLVADVNGEVVGYLVGYTRTPSSLGTIPSAELESMFVRDGARYKGVGQRLIEAFLEWCREREVPRVAVTAYVANDGAVRFYERSGFEAKHVTLERLV